jgi:hypothetical protein
MRFESHSRIPVVQVASIMLALTCLLHGFAVAE